MVVVDAALGPPAAQVARDMELLDLVADGRVGPLVRLWRSAAGIVVPRRETSEPGFAGAAAACAARGWPVVLRGTGGTAFPIGPGTVQVSQFRVLEAHAHERLEESYQRLCDPLIAALGDVGLEARLGAALGSLCDGTHNICVLGRKLAGTAQRRRMRAKGGWVVLTHAAISIAGTVRPAMRAIEEYYGDLGHSARFDPGQHVALEDCLSMGLDNNEEARSSWALRWLEAAYRRWKR